MIPSSKRPRGSQSPATTSGASTGSTPPRRSTGSSRARASSPEHGTCFAWEHQPCIGAAFAPYDPPFAEHPELASPEGRIHFAGEHASGERGVGMQGALESGLRATSEVDPEVTGESAGAAVAISPSRGVHRFAADLCVPGWLAV